MPDRHNAQFWEDNRLPTHAKAPAFLENSRSAEFAARLLRRGDEAGLKELLAAYEDEGSARWLYTRALLAFREGRVSEDEVVLAVKDARSANEQVPAILAGTLSPVVPENDYITVDGPDEATEYVSECGPA